MKLNYIEAELRKFPTSFIYSQLSDKAADYSIFNIVVLCDELLLRKQPIKFIKNRFENLVKKLNTESLKTIDTYDFNYSKAAVHVAINELKTRKVDFIEWFYLDDYKTEKGPIDRVRIDELIEKKKITHSTLLWKKGMVEWKSLEQLPYLHGKLYYDQEFATKEEKLPIRPIKEQSSVNSQRQSSTGSYTVLPGIMELLSFPVWIFLLFAFSISGFNSEMGVIIPLMFSLFVLVSTIPVGIGLITKRKWAWSIKITTAIITIVIVLFKILVDQASSVWMIVLVYESIILGILFYGKEIYNERVIAS